MCSTLPDFLQEIGKKMARPSLQGLILRNTGFIVAGTIIRLCVECRQVIEEFIEQVGQASPLVIIMSGEDA